jgi:CelD/BcsL family acetyltransferase involved in cellulose biosynthesis
MANAVETPRRDERPYSLERLESFDDLRSEWDELAQAAANPFQTLAWVEGWFHHVQFQQRLTLFACRRADASLGAILPLTITRGRYVRKLRFLGFGAANELGPICAPSDLPSAVDALRRALLETRQEWDVFLGDYLPGHGWTKSLDAQRLTTTPNPIVEIKWSSWDDCLTSRSGHFRQTFRRGERLAAKSGISTRVIVDEEDVPSALDNLFALHRARWGPDVTPWFAGMEPFHREFATWAFRKKMLRLLVVELGERPLAISYGFRIGGMEWWYGLGRDVTVDRHSLGLIAMAQHIRDAIDDGLRVVRLGPGAQRYKLAFATGDAALETVGIARGLLGRASLSVWKHRLAAR